MRALLRSNSFTVLLLITWIMGTVFWQRFVDLSAASDVMYSSFEQCLAKALEQNDPSYDHCTRYAAKAFHARLDGSWLNVLPAALLPIIMVYVFVYRPRSQQRQALDRRMSVNVNDPKPEQAGQLSQAHVAKPPARN